MVTFETIKEEEIPFGVNDENFIVVAHKVATDESGSIEFVAITRGYITGDGSRRYKTNLTLPADYDTVRKVSEMLAKVMGIPENPL